MVTKKDNGKRCSNGWDRKGFNSFSDFLPLELEKVAGKETQIICGERIKEKSVFCASKQRHQLHVNKSAKWVVFDGQL
ncbi:hypothetical protein [Allofournierella massiliensis]|uniref:hypothetical protein n=1 Tax=Allofournierella massiliensis TaxID=1650663 RepID=UPI0035698C05